MNGKIIELLKDASRQGQPTYTDEERISEVVATERLAGLHPDDEDIQLMWEVHNGNISTEQIREKILKEATE